MGRRGTAKSRPAPSWPRPTAQPGRPTWHGWRPATASMTPRMVPSTAVGLKPQSLACGSAAGPPRPLLLEFLMPDYPNPPAALLEPSTACAAGDRVPCHLFLPDVAWPAPLGPVIRPERARHRVFMQPPVTPWRLAAGAGLLLSVAAGLLVYGPRSEAAPVVVARAPVVVVARPAPVAPRPAPRPVVHVPAPVVVSPSLARPAVRCERNGLGQCVGVPR